MKFIINDQNLEKNEIEKKLIKSRAILANLNSEILIANYGELFLFPDGKLESNETIEQALIRELKEETEGIYLKEELNYFCSLTHFQKNYPTRNQEIKNILVETHYFLGEIKKVFL